MLLTGRTLRVSLLAGAACLALAPKAFAGNFSISNSSNTAQTLSAGNQGTVTNTGTLTAPVTWDITGNPASGAAVLTNFGTINTGGSRSIDTGSGTANGAQSFTLNNKANAILSSTTDTFRVNKDIGAGTVTVDNAGTIRATSASGGRAISLNAGIVSSSSNVSITNELGGVISAAGDDALRPGTGHVTITNSGSILSTSAGATVGRGVNLNLNATATTDLSSLKSFSLTNNSTGIIQSVGDGVRISASVLSTDANTNYAVSVTNAGTIQSTGAGSLVVSGKSVDQTGQAIDLDDLQSPNGSITITNQASGLIQAADADAIRPGNNSLIINAGTIIALNGTPTSSGNDGIDFRSTNSGTVNNSGTIMGARHGITGDLNEVIINSGSITGNAGSGINLDTISGTTTITNSTSGVITGTIPAGAAGLDGDGIDVDYLVNIDNSGQILAKGIGTGSAPDGPVLNEAVTIGGGTITNRAGALIQSDQRAITVDNSSGGSAYAATTIDNTGTITGSDGEAISITSSGTIENTLINRGGGVINGSVTLGSGADNITLYTGSTLNGALNGGGGGDTIHLVGAGSGTLANVANVGTLSVEGGTWAVSGGQSYSGGTTVAGGATAQVSGALNGGVVNNGTVSVQNGAASFDGNFQNNGALVSDPASISMVDLTIGANGYIQAAPGDLYQLSGDFLNGSTENTLWDTSGATLEFIDAGDPSHSLELNGTNFGAHLSGADDNFSWGTLDIDSGNALSLEDFGTGPHALYVDDLLGALISGDTVTNIAGLDGLTIYYNGNDAQNQYLHDLTYHLSGGGLLISDNVPEPESWTLFITGFGLLGAVLRRRRTLPDPAR